MPPVKLVLGNLAAIEDALARRVADARRAAPLAPVTVLVGSTLLRPYLRRALARNGAPLLNVRFLRPNELAASLAPTDAGAALTPAVERFLVREVAAAAAGYFAPVRGRDGFANALRRLFRELELAGFAPPDFGRVCATPHPDDPGKLDALAALYAAYAARRDAARLRPFAAAYAGANPRRHEGPLFVYGLWQPPEIAARLVESIAPQTDVTVFLPSAGGDADAAHAAFRARLAAAGAVTEHLPPEPLDTVASRLFAHPPPGAAPLSDAPVRLISAPDTVREVWEAARACLAWAREGVPFHEIAVVYHHADPYRDLVAEVFREAKIETYLHEGRLLAGHPLGRRLLALIDLAARPEVFSRAHVMEFLTETRLPRATVDAYDRVRPSEWESYTREAGVVEGIDQWRQRLARLAAEKRDGARSEGYEYLADVAARIETLLRFAEDFHAALAARPEEATWDEHLAFLRDLAARYAAGVEPILDALADLAQISAVRERAPFDVFVRAVRDDLAERDAARALGEEPREFARRGVAVVDARSFRHTRFRCVWLLGVAERAWPPPPRPDPILLEHERRAINDAGPGALPLRTEPDEETLAFWLAAQSATQALAVSFARAAAGRSARHLPSYFFRALAEALEGRPLSLDDVERSAFVHRIEAGRLACDPIADSLSEAEYDRGLVRRANRGDEPAAVAALADLTPRFGRAVAARRARWSAQLTAHDGVMLNGDAVAAARESSPLERAVPVSPSRLETWATCPYRYFMQYALRVIAVEEPERIDRMDHLQRGSLVHEIFQRFLAELGRDDPPSADARERHLPRLLDIARDCGDDRQRRGLTGRPLVWRRDFQEIVDDLVRWYDEEVKEAATGERLRPGAFEARFGPVTHGRDGEDPHVSSDDPLVLDVAGRRLLLQGRIDRIDWDDERTRFRVIDYKTGQARARGVFARGEALQLPVYIHAAAGLLGIGPFRGEAQYFYATGRGGFKRHVFSGDDLAAHGEDFQRVLATVATGIGDGYFAPNPAHDHCRWCDYRDVCDVRIDRIMARKQDDPRAAAYIALEDIE